MKHLQPELLAAAAEGQSLTPAQRAHLAACPACSAELAELYALLADLAEVPVPPKALHQSTLQRIGLAPKQAPGWSLRWTWAGGVLAAGVALVLALPAPAPQRKCSPPLATAKAQACKAKAMPAPVASVPAEPAGVSTPLPQEALAISDETLATRVVEAQAAQGQAPAEAPQQQVLPRAEQAVEGGAKAAPTAKMSPLEVSGLRGNLLRPSLGEYLSVDLKLGQNDLLTAHVFDSRGRLVAELFRGHVGPGPLQLSWDGQNEPSGAYTLMLKFGTQTKMIKAVIVH